MKNSISFKMWNAKLTIFLISLILLGCEPASLQEGTSTPPHSNNTVVPFSQTSNLRIPTLAPTPTIPTEIAATALYPAPDTLPIPITMPDLFGSVNMTYDRNLQAVVAFGGSHFPECVECNETWIWNAVSWQQPLPQANPPGRIRAGFAYDDATKNAILFGSPHDPLSNDTWVWDGQNWQEKHPLISPPARWGLPGNILVYDASRQVVLLFGGVVPGNPMVMGAEDAVNDTWLWNGDTWKQANPEETPPPPQGSGVYMAYDDANQVVVLLDLDTTWTWNGKTWTQQTPSHQPFVVPDGAMGYDELRHETVLLGMQSASSLNIYSSWVWDGKDWTEIKTNTSQIDTYQFGGEMHMVYDTKHQKLLLFSLGLGFFAWEWTGDGWQNLYGNLSGQVPRK